MTPPSPNPTPADGEDKLKDADKLDFRSWFQRVWWEAYRAGGEDAKRFTASTHLLDKALPEFEILLAASNQQAVQEALIDGFQSLRERVDEAATLDKDFRVIRADDLIKSIDDIIAALAAAQPRKDGDENT